MFHKKGFHSDRPSFVIHNKNLAMLMHESYKPADIEQIRRELVGRGTLAIRRYSDGGSSAVTVLDLLKLDSTIDTLAGMKGDRNAIALFLKELSERSERSLHSALDGLLAFEWDRDTICQAIAELAIHLDPSLGAGLNIAPGTWNSGLLGVLKHHYRRQERFLKVIAGPDNGGVSGLDMSAGPSIRWNPASKDDLDNQTRANLAAKWGYRQNDSLGFDQWLLFYAVNRGLLSWDDPSLQPEANAFACLLHNFWRRVNLWTDFELGAWEDCEALHTSSLLVAAVSLWEQMRFMQKHHTLHYEAPSEQMQFMQKHHNLRHGLPRQDSLLVEQFVREADVGELYNQCANSLARILPNEFLESRRDGQRHVDAALVNGLMLAQLSGCPIVSDAMTIRIIENIERDLMGPHGISRYPGDKWDGRNDRFDLAAGEEAKWCHVSPMISVIIGRIYRRTGNEQLLEHQTYHFNRALAGVNERWNVPEAYIIDPISRNWVPDANEPLAWAQAVVILAIAGMKESLKHQAASSQGG